MLKSAYEIALEKSGSSPDRRLDEGKKRALAEIESRYAAQIAQKEIVLATELRGASPDEAAALRERFNAEREEIESRREREKEKVRRGD